MNDISGSDILQLAELLRPKKENSDSEDECEENLNKATEGTTKETNGRRCKPKQSVYAKLSDLEQNLPKNTESIENEDDLYFDEEAKAASDWRTTPQWEISYKQQVTPSDVFLQMNNKGPSTASCEDIILKVSLPEESYRNIDLKVLKERIQLTSPKYRLDIPLPHPVDPKCGDAKWDKDLEKLTITLKMDREFDYINF